MHKYKSIPIILNVFFFRLRQFVRHQFSVKTAYDIHSPFVWKFYHEILRSKETPENQNSIEDQRKLLLRDPRVISFLDKGAASNSIKNLKVKDIAATSLKKRKECELLYRLIKQQGFVNILELGTSLGITSLYLASTSQNAQLHTIDASKAVLEKAKNAALCCELNNIHFTEGNFDEVLLPLLESIPSPDFVFIDGNHTYKATIQYFNWLLKYISPHSILVFDDIYWSKGMKKAWDEIRSNPEVSLSIDLYSMGMVFFRKEIRKQHFSFRF